LLLAAVLLAEGGARVVLAALLMWPLAARMDAEERLLGETFGDEYRAYRARTARLIPGLY
jgi:protein-S-isoprenylcysteine O-methyltransferase Ste14